MPQVAELFRISGFGLNVEDLRVSVLYGLLVVAGGYYLIVALRSMFGTSRRRHTKTVERIQKEMVDVRREI